MPAIWKVKKPSSTIACPWAYPDCGWSHKSTFPARSSLFNTTRARSEIVVRRHPHFRLYVFTQCAGSESSESYTRLARRAAADFDRGSYTPYSFTNLPGSSIGQQQHSMFYISSLLRAMSMRCEL